MKLIDRFAPLAPEKRPQDPHRNGRGLRFQTMEHGGEYDGFETSVEAGPPES